MYNPAGLSPATQSASCTGECWGAVNAQPSRFPPAQPSQLQGHMGRSMHSPARYPKLIVGVHSPAASHPILPCKPASSLHGSTGRGNIKTRSSINSSLMPLLKCWIFLIYPLMTGRKGELQNGIFVVGGRGVRGICKKVLLFCL